MVWGRSRTVVIRVLVGLVVSVLLGVSGARAIAQDGALWSWGGNSSGQLGLGDTTNRSTPTEATFFLWRTVTVVAAGSHYTLALTSDGKLWTWGDNDYGQLGLGDTTSRSTPTEVTFFSGKTVTALTSGGYYALALTSDGKLWAWGDNRFGQLGLGDAINRSTPTQVTFFSGKTITNVATGDYYALALTSDGKLRAWGYNNLGQLGLGDTADRSTPTEVTFFRGKTVTALCAGGYHALALTSDGKLHAWGDNEFGQLGLGYSTGWPYDVSSPTEVTALSGQSITALRAGLYHTLALTSDGKLRTWGYNNYGQLGLGDTTNRSTPTEVIALSGMNIIAVATGFAHTLALASNGQLWAWGDNRHCQLGLGDADTRTAPTEVTGLAGNAVTVVAAGGLHTVVLANNTRPSALWTWGFNAYGQLGLGDRTDRVTPAELTPFSGKGVVAVAAGSAHSLALTHDGTVWSWGENSWYQLGLGDTIGRSAPAEVASISDSEVAGLAAGAYHSVARTSSGSVWSWGQNAFGQLGLGDTTSRTTPAEVTFPASTAVTALAAGYSHTLALAADGRLWSWGDNSAGQLGLGNTLNQTTPAAVSFFSGSIVTALAAGAGHSLALTSDGKLWAWGWNEHGQLGLGDVAQRDTPAEVSFVAGQHVTAVAAGYHFTLALTSDGKLWAWGNNAAGQLGLGDTVQRRTPTEVTFYSDQAVVAVWAGYGSTFARTSNGTLWACGGNGSGQLGLGDTIQRSTPTQATGFTGRIVTLLDGGGGHTLAVSCPNTVPVADDQSIAATTAVPKAIALTGSDGDGDPLTYHIVTGPSHGSLTGSPPNVTYTSDDTHSGADSFTFKVNDGYDDSAAATVTITIEKADTILYATDRSGTITEAVALRAYDLKRTTDNAFLSGKTIVFSIDGTAVGTGTTDAGGDASYNWNIAAGPAARTITAAFEGDAAYNPSSANATLICQSWTTKMVVFGRTARITDRTELKARLLRSDNAPLYGKTIAFFIDGTFIINRNTNTDGYASHPNYDVPDGAGAGNRTIRADWAGNAGYTAISREATLTVLKAIPYIWVLSKSVPQGGIANLYSYFRRLYDYKKMENKPVTFRIDGTWIADVNTGTVASGEPGVARYLHNTTGLGLGPHTVRCEFAGDAWLDAGFGEGNLNIL